MEFVDVVRITIYTGEDVLWEDMPLYKAIIQKAKRRLFLVHDYSIVS